MFFLIFLFVFYYSIILIFFIKYFFGRNIQVILIVDFFMYLIEYVFCIYIVKKLEIDLMRFSVVDVLECL